MLHEHGSEMLWPARAEMDKCFHVSPLIDMQARYRFKFNKPGNRIAVSIEEHQDDALMLVATQTGEKFELTDMNLLRAFVRTPLMTFKVMTAIHWQALKIWLRGATFYKRPTPPKEQVTS